MPMLVGSQHNQSVEPQRHLLVGDGEDALEQIAATQVTCGLGDKSQPHGPKAHGCEHLPGIRQVGDLRQDQIQGYT